MVSYFAKKNKFIDGVLCSSKNNFNIYKSINIIINKIFENKKNDMN